MPERIASCDKEGKHICEMEVAWQIEAVCEGWPSFKAIFFSCRKHKEAVIRREQKRLGSELRITVKLFP